MNIDKQYQELLQTILDHGIEKKDRTGTGTRSIFGYTIRHNMKDGFPLLTSKHIKFNLIVTELLWFLKGDTNIQYLVKNRCNIWNGDAYKAYQNAIAEVGLFDSMMDQEEFIQRIKTDDEFAQRWGELGPIYGKQWRKWSVYPNEYGEYESNPIDQIQNLIDEIKTNPDSRRLMVSAWNPSNLHDMVLPPCHYGFQVYTRELSQSERFSWYGNKIGSYMHHDHIEQEMDEMNVPKRAISLMFNMRSNDVPLGLPFNIASYGLLLEIIGNMVNMIPDELIANLGDAHIYKNQIDGVKEQLTRTPMKLPNLIISDDVNFNGTIDDFLDSCTRDSFKLDGYESHPSIKMPLSN